MSRLQGRARTAQEQRSLRTRERLANSAIECLVESGYRGTTFVEVCRRAGLTRGAAHHHYRDMPALLLDVMALLNRRLRERALPAVVDVPDTEKRLEGAVDAVWEIFEGREFRAVVEILVAQSHDRALRDRLRPELERYEASINEGFHRRFPELVEQAGEEPAMLIVRSALVFAIGMGFTHTTLDLDGIGFSERARMLALLKRSIHRELAYLREQHSPSPG